MTLQVKGVRCGGEVLLEWSNGGEDTVEFEVRDLAANTLEVKIVEASTQHQYPITGLRLKTGYECRARQPGSDAWSNTVTFTTNGYEKHQMVCASCGHKFCGSYYKYFCNDEFYVCGDHGCCVCRFYEKKCAQCDYQ